jgi:predicted HTH transcriptional regulator
LRMEKEFDVDRPRTEAAALLADEGVLTDLFPDSTTEIVARKGQRKTIESHYTALGREGVATFHFDYEPGGDVSFEKVCDGRIWRELRGAVTLTERKQKTRVRIELEGRTKALIPEFTIRGPMQDQLDQMAKALRKRFSAKS